MFDGFRIVRSSYILSIILLLPMPASAVDWLPVSADELNMTAEPQAPHAAAIYLYRQVDRSDGDPSEFVYERIKILTEEGKTRGNVEIQYYRDRERITGIEARTIRPDGSIVPFTGQVFEKPLAKSRQAQFLAKTFTMPEVGVGSIIEYRFRRYLGYGFVYDSHWTLNADLFTKLGRFTLTPADGFALQWTYPTELPPGTTAPVKQGNRIRMEVRDVPAFISEDYAPPAEQLKQRVDFIYSLPEDYEKTPELFWNKQARKLYRKVHRFIDRESAMRKAVAQIVQPQDSPETRLRKIYARVQQIRNISFERDRTDEEMKREHLDSIEDVEDVWNRGAGDATQINWLFLALVRAAAIESDPVLVATRDQQFFQVNVMNQWQLNTSLVRVVEDGSFRFLDPGMRFAPYGVLPWPETGVIGRVLQETGGGWVRTPVPTSIESRIERKARLELNEDGSVAGKLTVTFTGLQALTRRVDERNADHAERKRYLESEIKELVPVGIDVDLINEPDWIGSTPMLVAEFSLRVPGWASGSGRRLLMPVSMFTGRLSEVFSHGTRKYPLYFDFPFQENDYLSIHIPRTLQVGGLPKPQSRDLKIVAYALHEAADGDTLSLDRQMSVDGVLIPVEKFEDLRGFFQSLKAADEEQVIITKAVVGKH